MLCIRIGDKCNGNYRNIQFKTNFLSQRISFKIFHFVPSVKEFANGMQQAFKIATKTFLSKNVFNFFSFY